MISPKLAFIATIFYSFFIALQSEIYVTFFAPVIFVSLINYKLIAKIAVKILFLNIFIALIALNFWYFGQTKMAILVALRANLIIFFTLLLFYKFNIFEICSGIAEIKFCAKFAFLLFFSVKFIDALKKEFKRILKTLKARSFIAKTDIFSLKTYANIVGILFICAINRSENLQKALIVRNFNGNFKIIGSAQKINFAEILLLITIICVFIKKGQIL